MTTTNKDFLTYLLLFATHADFKFDEDEREYILSKVDEPTLKKVNREFQKHNDFQRIETIRTYLEAKEYSDQEIQDLIDEVIAVFHIDGTIQYSSKT